MPLFKQIELANSCHIGIWRIDEPEEDLIQMLQLNEQELAELATMNSGKRFLHWLSSRVMIRKMLNTNQFIEMSKDEYGKPLLVNFDYDISISHSKEFACVMIGEKSKVGIDIEHMDPKVERIAHKFMRTEELDSLSADSEMEQMYVYWCAKEVLYKIYGRKKLRFKENIPIQPFEYQEIGKIIGEVTTDQYNQEFSIDYIKIEDYMLAYSTGILDDHWP